jgi:hypothetical protein
MMGKYGVFKQGPGSGSLEHVNAWPEVDTCQTKSLLAAHQGRGPFGSTIPL